MIITSQKFRIKPNNKKWKAGYINFHKSVTEQLNFKEQEIDIIIFKPGEISDMDEDKLKEVLAKMKEKQEIDREVKKLMEGAEIEINTGE